MSTKTLYQTLQDRGDADKVERDGPFHCRWENSWLGDGYYYWDTFFELAEWWGEKRYPNKYMICEAKYDFDENLVFDLVGNMSHIVIFKSSLEKMKINGLLKPDTTVSRVLRYMKDEIKVFRYEATRVHGYNSISPNDLISSKFINRIKFEISKGQYLDLLPAVQLCIYNKRGLGLRNYSVVYPEHYREEMVI